MAIEITPSTEALLKREAKRQGRSASTLADDLLARALAESAREFEETVAGIQRGRQAGEEGRERPIQEYIAEVQVRRAAREAVERGPK